MDMDRFGEVQIKRSVMKNIRNTRFSGCGKAGIGRNYARFFRIKIPWWCLRRQG